MKKKFAKLSSIFLCFVIAAMYSMPSFASTETSTKESDTQSSPAVSTEQVDTSSQSSKGGSVAESDDSTDDTTDTTDNTESGSNTGSDVSLPASGDDDNIHWNVDTDGVLTISGSGQMKNYTSDKLPPWQNYSQYITSFVVEDGITFVGNYACNNYANLKSVQIPASVTQIGMSFQYCSALTSVDLPKSITFIGAWAFNHCDNLSEVIIRSKNITINEAAFNGSNQVTIKSDPTSQAKDFAEKYNYPWQCIEYTIPASGDDDNIHWDIDADGVLTISGSGQMKNYTSDELPPWQNYSQYITSLVVEDGITFVGNYACNNYANLKSVQIPASVTQIGMSFQYCSALTSVDLPKSITFIGAWAFNHCDNLSEVIIRSTEITINEAAFNGSNQVSIKCDPTSQAKDFAKKYNYSWQCIEHTFGTDEIETEPTCVDPGTGYHVCTECGYKETWTIDPPGTHTWSTDYTIDKEPTTSEAGQRSIHCTVCDEINEETVKSIPKIDGDCGGTIVNGAIVWSLDKSSGTLTFKGEGAMPDYANSGSNVAPWRTDEYIGLVKSIVVNEGITSIGEYAFTDFTNVQTVSLPNSLKTIENSAFSKCSSIEEVTLPENVETVGSVAFGWTNSLKKVYVKGNQTTFHEKAFRRNATDFGKVTIVCSPLAAATKAYAESNENTTWGCAHVWKTYTKKAGYLKNGTTYSYCTGCGLKKNVKTLAGYSKYIVKKLKVKKGKKSFKVSWKKASKANKKVISGYQIRYSKKSSMASSKYVKVGKTSKGKTIKKLSKKTKYYVQVRNYMKKGGKTYYSKWSAKKTVKTK